MKSDSPNSSGVPQPPARGGLVAGILALIALLVFFFWNSSRTLHQPSHNTQAKAGKTAEKTDPRRPTLSHAGSTTDATSNVASNKYPTLTPQRMQLVPKILASHKWNDGPDAFGLDRPPPGQEGAWIGPNAVAYLDGKTYLLDNPNKRILCYDQNGKIISSVPLPNKVATDLVIDVSGTGLVLIDHMHDKVYKVDGNELKLLANVPLKNDFPLQTKFTYDSATGNLSPLMSMDDVAGIDGNNIVLHLNNNENLGINFDKPVACVEEVTTDANGIIWVLYTLEGDFRFRRVARVDRARQTVQTTELDVWFGFDATRHMVPTGNGVVIFAGDTERGRLISYSYDGVATF